MTVQELLTLTRRYRGFIAALLLRSKPGAHFPVRPLDGAELRSAYPRLALSRRERHLIQIMIIHDCRASLRLALI